MLFVIKIINTSEAELRKWYRNKDGELYICRWDKRTNTYRTVGYINDNCALGDIEKYFSQVITEFEYQEK